MRGVLLDRRGDLLQRVPDAGLWALREAVAGELYRQRGVRVSPEQVYIGAGAEYFYNLLIQFLGREKIFALEEPGHRKIARVYQANGVQMRLIRMDGDGVLPQALQKSGAQVPHISPAHQYPTGAVMPIRDMIRATRRKSPLALFHTDAVQGFLKVPFRAKALGADMISVSAHKIHAAKGTGALYIRPGLPLPAFLNGGGQESNYRSGTENMPGICGFGAACADTDAKADMEHMAHLRDLAREKLSGIDGLVLIGSQTAPHIVNLSIPGLRSQGIINCLQDREIYVSAGSACSRGHRSHVLEALHLPPAVIDGSIRVSFCPENTEADVAALHDALCEAVRVLKG